MIKLDIKIDSNDFIEFQNKIKNRITKLKKVFQDFYKIYLSEFAGRSFDTNGNSIGNNWPALRPSTIRAKGNSKALVNTGRLRNSVRTGSGLTFKATDDSFSIKVNNSVPYGKYHMTGTKFIPVRNYLFDDSRNGLPERAVKVLIDMLEKHIGDDK